MRKLLIGSVVIVFAAGISSCDLLWEEARVPEKVKQQFTRLYPSITEVEWDVEDGLFEAEFEISEREREALFNNDGKLLQYIEEMEEQYLPQAALETLQAHYNKFSITEALRVQEQNNTRYRVGLKQKQADLILFFDADGQLLESSGTVNATNQTPLTASLANGSLPESLQEQAFSKPVAQWELPKELREVSGIALVEDNLMACIQDEEGAIYLYDLQKKEITRKIPFAGPGDYEAIALVGNTAFVLRSDGALYEVPEFMNGRPDAVLHSSVVTSTQNTEGLAYDKENNRLLIACKGYDEALGERKGIYAFSLESKTMEKVPVITISVTQEALRNNGKKMKDRYEALQASSLEIQEGTGTIYLLDATNYRLLTISDKGQVEQLAELDKKLLRQAEGLTFGSNGELYIASEGSKKGRGVLVKYQRPF